MRIAALSACAALLFALPAAAQAATTFAVTSATDAPLLDGAPMGTCTSTLSDGACTLRAALQAASSDSADTNIRIAVRAGEYDLTIGQPADAVADGSAGNLVLSYNDPSGASKLTTVTITGAGSGVTVIKGVWSSGAPDRILQILGDSDANAPAAGTSDFTVDLSGVTIEGGAAASGSVHMGGGVLVGNEATVAISGSVITGNTAGDPSANDEGLIADGGGLAVDNQILAPELAVNEDTVADPTPAAPQVSVTDSTISDNTAANDGGGVAGSGDGASFLFAGDALTGNLALTEPGPVDDSAPGGGAYFDPGSGGPSPDSATFVNDTITANVAGNAQPSDTAGCSPASDADSLSTAGDGGGIDLSSQSAAAAVETKAAATELASTPTATLTNDTIAGNCSTSALVSAPQGGDIASLGGLLTLRNTIVAAGLQQGVATEDVVRRSLVESLNCDDGRALGAPSTGTIVSSGNNLFDDDGDECGAVASDLTNPVAGTGLQSLALNPPGTTETEALDPTSPAIAAAAAATCPTTDQRGLPRHSPCDIGAFELDADVAPTGRAAPDPSTAGTPTTFTFLVNNAGPDPGLGTTFTVPIPANATLQSDSASAGRCGGTTTVTCSFGTVDAQGATPGLMTGVPADVSSGITVSITVVPTGGSSVSLTGAAGASDLERDVTGNSVTLTDPLIVLPTTAVTTTTTTTASTSSAATPVASTSAPSGGVKAVTVAVAPLLPAKACTSVRAFVIHIQHVAELHIVSAVIYVNGHREMTVRRHLKGPVDLRNLPYGTFVVLIVARQQDGHELRGTRTYHTCRGTPLPGHKFLKL